MFTAAGSGTGNAVDYFRDVSHGRADLGGSQVYGWFLMNHSKADLNAYRQEMIAEDKKNGTALAQKLTRQRIVDWGAEAAAEHDVDLSKFFATVFVFSGAVDYFGRAGAVVVNFNPDDPQMFSVDLTGVSHEMGHGYGLTHSLRDGATSGYGDSWDIMSAYSVHEARSSSVPASGNTSTPSSALAPTSRCPPWPCARAEPSGPAARGIGPLSREDVSRLISRR